MDGRGGARGEIAHAGRTLRPLAARFRAAPGGGAAALTWLRPSGVLVEEGTRRRVVPIGDPTRRLQWLLLAAGLAVGGAMRIAARRLRRGER